MRRSVISGCFSGSEATEGVVGRVLVALGERRVVEDHLDEGVDASAEGHDRLPDVHELGGALADAVDAEELAAVSLDEQLDDAVAVADDLAARVVAIEGAADDEVLARLL